MSDKIREAFEAANPIPEGVVRYQDGYILHTIGTLSPAFSFIKAGEFIAKFAGYKEGWQAALAQQPATAVPEGWKLVPVEATEAMIDAADRVQDGENFGLDDIYSAMLAAAPAAPVAVGQDLPYWEPCNPGCDPEFNGFRTRHCVCAEAKAAQANTPAGRLKPGAHEQMRIEMSDGRMPYTYAADYVRGLAGYNANGAKLSRSDASQIRQGIAKAIGMDDAELAEKLAVYFKAHQDELAEKHAREFIAACLGN